MEMIVASVNVPHLGLPRLADMVANKTSSTA
jgi:hypothetical protein